MGADIHWCGAETLTCMSPVSPINTMSCPIKVNNNTIELTVRTSCYCVLDLLCVNCLMKCNTAFYKNGKRKVMLKNNFLNQSPRGESGVKVFLGIINFTLFQ